MKTFDSPFVKELRKQALEKGFPLMMDFEFTGRCNLNCKMCYVHVMDDTAAKQSELSTEQWKHIFDQTIDAGMMYALLTGGECLLRPDFEELYLYLVEHGVKVRVNTNALLLNEKRIDFFCKNEPENIQVTLYGSCDGVYEAVTEKRVFSQVRENLFRLRDSGLEYHIVCTPNRFSYDDYRKMIRFLKDNQFHFLFSNNLSLVDVREAATREPFDLTQEELVNIIRIYREEYGLKPYSNDMIPAPCGACSQPVQHGSPCRAGRSAGAVTWRGVLQPCVSMTEISYSLLELPFIEAWNRLKEDCKNIAQPIECVDCAYNKICEICPTIRYNGLYSGHCNPQACEYAVKMAKAGVVKLKAKKN